MNMWIDRSQSPVILEWRNFEEAASEQGKAFPTARRAWLASAKAAEYFIPMTLAERRARYYDQPDGITLNFSSLILTIRAIECGSTEMPHNLGRVTWDIVASINNQGLDADDVSRVVPWMPEIHANFQSPESRRQLAAERLRAVYYELTGLPVAAEAGLNEN